ncbi:uncharacterized protein LOC133880511 isoform X2 [Alnus glutinosa]|uniref:uncharacterized protein LOC133880511 isoform X2 n=1 Tax=Alnus glutinosa TaxID=3517 RepID=UPI002D78C8BC|nr:uncharacterized protein LOC133880511 isoform X2 [Alnus glutinosa]XP_062175446.1 uncharacterized protein LOC133880511 isoform X2 [Alnus glutinosa]
MGLQVSLLANLDESFLRTRCNLGYRASRVLKLAQGIVEGRIQLTQLEEACKGASLSSYNMLDDQLKGIDGFGPFTCANVLMCMGFYHVIPTDSETIRHLRQVHAKKSNSQTVQRDVENISMGSMRHFSSWNTGLNSGTSMRKDLGS